jgi:hypothetical protein
MYVCVCKYVCVYIHGGTDCIIKGNLDEFWLQRINVYKTRTLPVVLCGCKNLSLTLREEYSMRVFENMVLSRMFEPKRIK